MELLFAVNISKNFKFDISEVIEVIILLSSWSVLRSVCWNISFGIAVNELECRSIIFKCFLLFSDLDGNFGTNSLGLVLFLKCFFAPSLFNESDYSNEKSSLCIIFFGLPIWMLLCLLFIINFMIQFILF